MKSIIAIALLSLSICGFINKEEVDFLKANAPFEVYEPEENPFRDYTEEQIRDLFTVQLDYPEGIEVGEEEDDAPESFDFRTQWPDCVGEIRNQASCGSCWAFSGAVAFQQRLCIAGGDKVVLSPQDSVSCDKANLRCQGGYLSRTWNYYKTIGLVTENCFPYTSQKGTVEACITECKDGSEWKKYKISDYSSFRGVAAIRNEIVAHGPVQLDSLSITISCHTNQESTDTFQEELLEDTLLSSLDGVLKTELSTGLPKTHGTRTGEKMDISK